MESEESPEKKKRRLCLYNVQWESEFDWLQKVVGNATHAKCKLCCCTFSVGFDGKHAVSSHEKTKKHIHASESAASSHTLKAFFTAPRTVLSDKVTVAEVVEVYHGVKHHMSYLAQDCSHKVQKSVIDDSDIVKRMSCGRTKTSAIVNNVLQPFALECVVAKLQSGLPFAVATDASNKGSRKFFPVAVQFYTPTDGIVSAIVDFYEDPFEDSRSVKTELCRVMGEHNLCWKNVSAYAADNASVNFGVNNSVYQKLAAEENPDIIAAHCNDHILHNCAKNALKLLSFDVENFVMKVYSEFSNSAMRRHELKECFDFFESEFHEVIRHVPTRWLSLFRALDRVLAGWMPLKSYFLSKGENDCSAYIWGILKEQENELSPEDRPTVFELYMYFVHFMMSEFQNHILKLENSSTTACDLFSIMDDLRKALADNLNDKFFGMKVKFALRKNYLPQAAVDRFTREAELVYDRAIKYLTKWFSFEKSPYRCYAPLSLTTVPQPPSLDDVLEAWMASPLKAEVPPDTLQKEVKALATAFDSIRSCRSTSDAWCSFFQKENAPTLLKLVQFVLSVPISNAYVERIFSVMGNIWTDERNRLSLEAVRSELMIFFNLNYPCHQFKDVVAENRRLLRAAQSDAKYH